MDRAKLIEIFPTLVPFAERVCRGPRAVGRGLLWFFRRIWKPVLVLFVVAFVIHGIATLIIVRRFAADIAAIKAKGDPVTMADLAGKPVPDEQNGAVVYAKALKMLGTEQAWQDVEVLDYFILKETDSPQQQYVSDRVRNIPDLWSAAKLAAQRLEAVVPLVQEAQARPICKFPVNWKDGNDALFLHYAELKELTRVLSWQAVVDAKEGRSAEAFHKIELAFKTARAVKDDPTITGTVMTVVSTRIADNSLRTVLEYGTPDESQMRKLNSMLSDTDLRHEFVTAMNGDRAMGLWIYEHNGIAPEMGCDDEINPTGSEPLFTGVELYIMRPVLYADCRYYLKHMAKFIDGSAKPYRLSNLRRLEKERRPAPMYAALLLPACSRDSADVDGIRAHTALTQVLLAAQVYKSKTGHYPESISELKAWKIPLDPFSGKELKYKRTSEGLQVYSIGMNLKDDGGMVPKDDDPRFGDIVLNWKH